MSTIEVYTPGVGTAPGVYTPVSAANPLPATLGAFPAGATALGASSGNVANATATATLAAAAGQTTYITGFDITGAGATAGSVVVATVTGLAGGTQSFVVAVPTGTLLGITPLVVEFGQAIPASAVNTAIVVSVPAFGAGNTNACVNARGFRI